MTASIHRHPVDRAVEHVFGQARGAFIDVIDAGANTGGYVSAWLSHGANRVIAIEPVPDCFAQLSTLYAEDPRVLTMQLAVSDAPGKLVAQNVHNCWTLLPEGSRVLDRALDYKGRPPFDVELDTIDHICSVVGASPRFMKIDVDGYDARAMRGARATIERCRPLIMLEMSYLPSILGDCCECMVRDALAPGYRMQQVHDGRIFDDARSFMRVFPWDTSFDVLLWPEETAPPVPLA